MSQFIKRLTSTGPIPGNIPTSFVTDSGTVIPSSNIVNVNGVDSNVNNDNGIRVIANLTGSENMVVQLTNRNTGTTTTSDGAGQTQTILSVPLGSGDGTYIAEGNLIAYNTTDALSSAYTFIGAARSTGGVGSEIGIENKNIWEESGMETADFSVSVSGNNLEVVVTGIAGKSINWNAIFTYRYVG